MSEADPILADDDDETVRRKALANLEGESRAKMAHSLESPRYVAAVRAAAGRRAQTEPHRRLVPTEIIQVIEDLRQRDPQSRERGEAVWRDPAAVSELTRALANQKARLLAQAAASAEAGDVDRRSPTSSARPRALRRVAAASLFLIALVGIAFLVLRSTTHEPSPDARATAAPPATSTIPQKGASASSATPIPPTASTRHTPTEAASIASSPPQATAATASKPAPVATASARPAASIKGPAAAPTGSVQHAPPLISNIPF